MPTPKLRRARTREQRSTAILRILREAAKHRRRKQPQPFYSIRDVSRHFHVSPATAARIFTKLKSEGLLRAIWGSKTLIESTQLDKQLRIRGVVALPAFLPSFCTVGDYRSFFASMRDVLWQLGFATRLIFYEGHDAEEPAFAELLLNYKVDVAIWFLPGPKIKETAACLADHGVRMITITDSCSNPGEHQYCISRESALKEALVEWQKSGISAAAVVHEPHCNTGIQLAMIERCLRDLKIRYTTMDIGLKASQDCLRASQQKDRAIVFPSSGPVAQFRCEYPTYFAKLLKESRIMLVHGASDLPMNDALKGAVDAIEVDWHAVAYRIGIDLVSLKASPKGKPVIFKGRWIRQKRVNGFV